MDRNFALITIPFFIGLQTYGLVDFATYILIMEMFNTTTFVSVKTQQENSTVWWRLRHRTFRELFIILELTVGKRRISNSFLLFALAPA